jgi:hypothetical protein
MILADEEESMSFLIKCVANILEEGGKGLIYGLKIKISVSSILTP